MPNAIETMPVIDKISCIYVRPFARTIIRC